MRECAVIMEKSENPKMRQSNENRGIGEIIGESLSLYALHNY